MNEYDDLIKHADSLSSTTVTAGEYDDLINHAQSLPEPPKTGISALPSDIEKRAGEFAETWQSEQGFPSKLWQTVGEAGGVVLDVAKRAGQSFIPKESTAFQSEYPQLAYMQPQTEKLLQESPIIKSIKSKEEDIGKTYQQFKKDNPELAKNLEEGLNIPAAMTLGKLSFDDLLGTAVVKGAGEATESVGKTFLQKGLIPKESKIKKVYGINKDEKTKNLLNDIVDFNLQNTGSYKNMANNARAIVDQKNQQVKDLTKQLITRPNPSTVNPAQIAQKLGNDAIRNTANIGERETAQNYVNNIVKEFAADGYDKEMTIDGLVEAKQNLNKRGDLFTGGPAPTENEALNKSLRKKIYLGMVDQIGEISPETRQLNREIKKLLDISEIADDAAFRTSKNKFIGLRETILGGAGAGGMMAAHGGALSPDALLYGLGIFGATKALSGGRGAGLLISAGKTMQKAASIEVAPVTKAIKKQKLSELGGKKLSIGNEIGSVGSIGDAQIEAGLTPAIKDPLTGKIHVGNWQGHKGALQTTQNPEVQKRLWNELFKDNTGKYTENIGFIDKQGNYISRSEAEKMLEKKYSGTLAQQYHDVSGSTALKMLGLTAGVSGGILTVGEIGKKLSELAQ